MNKGCIVALGVIGIVVLIVLVLGGSVIGTFNQEVSLRTAIENKQKDNTSEFDNLYKKIAQVAQVSEKSMSSLKEIVCGYAEARKGADNPNLIMNWIKESVPTVDLSTMNNLQNIIVGSRDSFTMRQKELLDLKREHDKLLRTFPSNVILGMFGRKEIDVKIVTSSKTEKAFETGKDDDTDVFKSKTENAK
jgi:hypothetical protein